MGMRPFATIARRLTVTDAGVDPGDLKGGEAAGIIDWPRTTNGQLVPEISIAVLGDDSTGAVHWMTGYADMVLADVVSASEDRQGFSQPIHPYQTRDHQSRAQEEHVKLGFKSDPGVVAVVEISVIAT